MTALVSGAHSATFAGSAVRLSATFASCANAVNKKKCERYCTHYRFLYQKLNRAPIVNRRGGFAVALIKPKLAELMFVFGLSNTG